MPTTSLQPQVAEEIRVLLLRRRLNAQDLAAQLGWSPSQLSRKLNSQVQFNIDDLFQISKILEVPVRDLLPPDEFTNNLACAA